MTSAANLLQGKVLDGGWRVIQKVERSADGSGGWFSVGYIVENSQGLRAFVKALDYSKFFGPDETDPATLLQRQTEAFNFEREICDLCSDNQLSRVVRAIGHGTTNVPEASGIQLVQYLIFEIADGDVRQTINQTNQVDIPLRFRFLRHVATALQQLHGIGFAHQDTKPSNLLVFELTDSKLSDLGCCSSADPIQEHDALSVAGDLSYAPPELLYGEVSPDWRCRRFGCDTYLLGSMVVYFFLGLGTTQLLFDKLRWEHHHSQWTGSYREVLPYVRVAFDSVLKELATESASFYGDDLEAIVRQLCEPDPHLRGHPKNRAAGRNQHSLERYISWFELLSRRAEFKLRAPT